MIVQGGNKFLSQYGKQGSSLKSERQDKGFQDLLVGSKKKKSAPEKMKSKPQPDKKKNETDAYDENQKVAKRPEPPVKKKIEGQRQPAKTAKVESVREPKSQSKEVVQQAKVTNQKFAQAGEKGIQPVDSLNLSGIENKTLEKNTNLLKNQENPFENMMAQMKMQQAASQKQQATLGSGMQAKIGAMTNSNEGGLKLGSEFDLSQGGETLSLNGLNANSGMQSMSHEGGEAASDQSMGQLDSLISQYMEQDPQVTGDESVTFADTIEGAESGKSERVENMQSIIKQARAFVDDGGGSMEIHLQPEGLGKIQLKVAVNDGQVNVEMMADTMAAKRVLEEGLFDIKNALEGQKLMVETLKVEMSPDYQKDFSDLANHMQEQESRDFAEQFLGQFRQERNQKHGGMFESFRNFQPGFEEPELTMRRNTFAENGKGRSINLVA